jgi:quercetin dioxygenase-like cupin family protein
MTFTKAILALACLMPGTLVAQAAKVTPLFSKDLTNLPGKEGLMVTVEYPPGSSDPIHRHNAHGFIYVLEGSIVMQVRGGKEMTLTPGQTFYEGPDEIHVVGRNASQTKPAKFVVFFVKDKALRCWCRPTRLRTTSISARKDGTLCLMVMRDTQGNGVFAISSACHRRRRIAASWWTLRVAHNDKLMGQSPIGSRTTRSAYRKLCLVLQRFPHSARNNVTWLVGKGSSLELRSRCC